MRTLVCYLWRQLTPSISADSVDLLLDSFNLKVKNVIDDIAPIKVSKETGRQKSFWRKSTAVQSRGLHGGPETRGPEDPGPDPRTGSGLYFKWSAVSGSGPNLLLRVPGLFNIPESIGEHRNREWSVSVSMRVFCNLQFVKLGWEKCEREIRWGKKNTRYLSRQKQSVGGVNVSSLQADGDHGFLHEWCEKKAETKLKRRTCYWTR